MDTQFRCLIVDKMHDSIVEMLAQINVEATYAPSISRDEIKAQIHDYDCMIIRSKTPVNGDLLATASRLKYIGRAGAGIDNLDMDWLTSKGIQVVNAPEGNRDAVAEHTVGLLLALFNNIVKANAEVSKGQWDREGNRGVELIHKTIGIIGFGNMGQAVAKRLAAFGCNILVYDKYLKSHEYGYHYKATIEEIYDKADVVTFHVPLTNETRGWVSTDFLNQFKKNIYLINTARGEIVSNAAVDEALKSGKILGAALDVLENEKLNLLTSEEKGIFNSLSCSNKVIITPHVAGWSFESYYKINRVLVDKLQEKIAEG